MEKGKGKGGQKREGREEWGRRGEGCIVDLWDGRPLD